MKTENPKVLCQKNPVNLFKLAGSHTFHFYTDSTHFIHLRVKENRNVSYPIQFWGLSRQGLLMFRKVLSVSHKKKSVFLMKKVSANLHISTKINFTYESSIAKCSHWVTFQDQRQSIEKTFLEHTES